MNGNLIFDYPFVLFAFLIFLPIFFYGIINSKKKNNQNRMKTLPANLNKKAKVSVLFFRLFLVFSIIAAASPRWGTGFTAAEYRRGLDAVFAIDLSRSMDIRDAQSVVAGTIPSRLERGLFIAGETAAAVTGARFAAAIGRGKGYLAVPLTRDYEAVLSFIEALDGSSMTGRSTNLEALLDAAAQAFVNSSAAHKAIILVSDGESHEGVIGNAVDRCVKEGIIVNTVALGSDAGRPLPENYVSGGTLIISRRNAAVMRNIAERTGGVYIDGSRNDAGAILSSNLLSIAQETGYQNTRKESKERRALFIILALFSYSLSKFLARSLPQKKPSQFILTSLVIIIAFTSCAGENSVNKTIEDFRSKMLLLEANYLSSRNRHDEAFVSYLKAINYKDAAPYAEFGIGLSSYLLDERKAALNRYAASLKILEAYPSGEHQELRYRNFYNSGIIFFEEEDYRSAAAAFKDALRVDPKRTDAKHNLELSLMSIAREEKTDNRRNIPQENETKEIIFEYLRQKEQQHWKSREWAPEESYSGLDY